MTPEEALAFVRGVAATAESMRFAPVPDDWPLRLALAIEALAAQIEEQRLTTRTVDLMPPTEEPHP